MSWQGFGVDGDTWESPEFLPPPMLRAFHARRSAWPCSLELVLRSMRDHIARQLLATKGPMFGVEVEVETAALPEYADAIFDFLATSAWVL